MENKRMPKRGFPKRTECYLAGGIFFVLLIVFFGGYLLNVFQTDTYAKWFYSLDDYRRLLCGSARYGEWLYTAFFYKIIGNPVYHRFFHVFIGILVDCAVCFVIWKEFYFRLQMENERWYLKIILIFLTASLRINVFYSDIFQYGVDVAVLFLGDLLAVVAAIVISKRETIAWYIVGCIMLIISLSFRQTCIFWYVFMGMTCYFFDYAPERKWGLGVKRIIKLLIGSLVSVLWIVICINFFALSQGRGNLSNIDVKVACRAIIRAIIELFWDCMGVQPRLFYSVIIILAFLVVALLMLKAKKDSAHAFIIFVVTLGGIFVTIFPSAFFDTYLPHRVVYGFAALFPVMLIMGLKFRDTDKRYFSNILGLMSVLLALNISFNWYFTANIYVGLVKTNQMDYQAASFYYSKIQEYEHRTGNKIRHIGYREDENYTFAFPGVIAPQSLNDRAYSTSWGRREILPYVTGESYDIVDFDEQLFDDFFGGKDWNTVSDEQVMCVGETAYIVLY